MLIAAIVSDYMDYRYNQKNGTWSWEKYRYSKLNKDDTYILIFNLQNQESVLKQFKQEYKKDINIIYESPPYRNTNHSSTQARNVVVVFETKD